MAILVTWSSKTSSSLWALGGLSRGAVFSLQRLFELPLQQKIPPSLDIFRFSSSTMSLKSGKALSGVSSVDESILLKETFFDPSRYARINIQNHLGLY